MWLRLGLIVMLSAVSVALSYAAYIQIYTGETEGFPLRNGSPAVPAGTYQAESELLSASLRIPAGGNQADTLLGSNRAPSTDTGNEAPLTCEGSSFQGVTDHGRSWPGAADLADAFTLDHLSNFYVMAFATDQTLGGLYSATPGESVVAGQIDCLDGDAALEASSTANNTFVTSIYGGSTWL